MNENEAKDQLLSHMFEGMVNGREELNLNEAWAFHAMHLAIQCGFVDEKRKAEMLKAAMADGPEMYKEIRRFFEGAEHGHKEYHHPDAEHRESTGNGQGNDATDNASVQRKGTKTDSGQTS